MRLTVFRHKEMRDKNVSEAYCRSTGPISACEGTLIAQEYEQFTFSTGAGNSTPPNPTGACARVSGNFTLGPGYNISKKSAVAGEFMWSGLPSNLFVLQPVGTPHSSIHPFSLTVNYRRQFERLNGSPFGVYVIGRGGWYSSYSTFDKDYRVAPGTVCLPVYYWWGYGCDASDYVCTHTVATKGSNSEGFNSGVGFTIRFSDSNWKFFTDARHHDAFTEKIPRTLVPVTMGLRFN